MYFLNSLLQHVTNCSQALGGYTATPRGIPVAREHFSLILKSNSSSMGGASKPGAASPSPYRVRSFFFHQPKSHPIFSQDMYQPPTSALFSSKPRSKYSNPF
eukprot:gb/GEZN01017524.1/.p1 GENE.gb/GEZN01017524.1/~~gb/GEZN01017524.1/.p1  ORF type:complete len:102 (+),score=6.44 gb/GEZN01017524.1/:409-714(+)